MGAAYRAMGRTAPLMDALSFHPYPNLNTDAPTRGYAYPNAGLPNLDRLMTAFDDAFAGTGQTTFRTGSRLRSTRSAGRSTPRVRRATRATRTCPSSTRRRRRSTTRTSCGSWSASPRSSRSASSTSSTSRTATGSRAASFAWTARVVLAYDAVKAAIAETGGTCAGVMKPSPWAVPATVAGVSVVFGKARSYPASHVAWRLTLSAAEDVAYSAGILRATAAGRAARLLGAVAGAQRPVLRARGTVRAYRKRTVAFPKRRLRAGRYVFAVRIGAAANPSRAKVTVSRPFVVR